LASWDDGGRRVLFIYRYKNPENGHTTVAAAGKGSFPPVKWDGIVHLAQKKRNSTKQRK
jgi:hypothetical protein